jgi:predicted ester cyclase
MSSENAQAVLDAIDAWSNHDRDRHRSRFADDAVLREHSTGREVHGADAITDVHWGWREAFPDGRGDVRSVVDGGDRVAVEVVWTGTHAGAARDPGRREHPGHPPHVLRPRQHGGRDAGREGDPARPLVRPHDAPQRARGDAGGPAGVGNR